MVTKFGNLFRWSPDAEEFTKPLQLKKPFKLLFDRLPIGIDNSRIDVTLSREFMNRCRLFVRRSMLHDVTENYWGSRRHRPITRICRRCARVMPV